MNIRAGQLPEPESNGTAYLKIPSTGAAPGFRWSKRSLPRSASFSTTRSRGWRRSPLASPILGLDPKLLGYVNHVDVDLPLVAGVAVAAIGGSFLGSRLADRINPATLRRAFAGFVLTLGLLILVRETETWLATARAALPTSASQLAFVLFVLAVGIAAGRVSRPAVADPLGERAFSEGAGI